MSGQSSHLNNYKNILAAVGVSLLTMILPTVAAADVAQGQYWHSADANNPPTYYSTYGAAQAALLATDAETAQMRLEQSNADAGLNEVMHLYRIPDEPVQTTDWTYGWYNMTWQTEQEMLDWLSDQEESDPQCASESLYYDIEWWDYKYSAGVATDQRATLQLDYEVYNTYWRQCFPLTMRYGVYRVRSAFCPDGFTARKQADGSYLCKHPRKEYVVSRPVEPPQYCEGNPCDVSNGDKIINETDFVAPGLEFKRSYHSNSSYKRSTLGEGWSHSYSSRLSSESTYPTYVLLTLDSGYQDTFVRKNSVWFASQSGTGRWLKYQVGAAEHTVYEPGGAKRVYGESPQASGYYPTSGTFRLLRETSSTGQVTTVAYDAEDRVDSVTGPHGHALDFVYGVNGNLEKVADPSGNDILLTHTTSASSNKTLLQKVTFQDGAVREYLYEMTDVENDTHITGIIDENLERFATYGYNTDGLVTASEHAGGKEKITLSYTGSTTQVVDNAQNATDYSFSADESRPRRVLSRAEAGASKTYTYPSYSQDNRSRPTQLVDELGNITAYSYDAWYLRSRTDAVGTSDERTTSYTYQWNGQPALIRTTSVRTGFNRDVSISYNASTWPTSVTVTGYQPDGTAVSRSTTMTYNGSGQVSTVDGPRTDVTDVTAFEYYDCTTGNECGQLEKITNALGHITTFDSYDANGRLLQMTDPNGLATSYGYDLRGRVLTTTLTPPAGAARVTTNTYDAAGQLKTVTTPDGMMLTYDYDAAHDLMSITDNFGNRIEYGYDGRGNRKDEDTYDPNGVLKRAVDYTFDAKDRIDTINNGGFTTDLVFDVLGNLTDEQDPKLATTRHSYDALGRLEQTIDALTGVTDYDYDVNDNLVSVSAPNAATTTYEYDDLGNLLEEVSPDRGTLTYSYDEAGNRKSVTDARGRLTTYSYDALDRLTLIALDGGGSIAYEYDVGSNALGRLNKITDGSGYTTWSYDGFGAVTGKTQTIGAVALTIGYSYDASGRLSATTLPSGRVVSYGYDAYLASSVAVDGTTILSGATYDPFGPVNAWTWGNGATSSRSYDLRGLISSHSIAGDVRALGYDAAGQLSSLDDARHTDSFDYDLLGRLDDFVHAGVSPLPGSQAFTFDGNGNRTSITESGTAYSYVSQANSNRLLSTAGPTARTYTYDASGNITADGIHTYAYDDRGRLVGLDSGAATYQHNGQGQRVTKDNGAVTLYAYDEAGQLIGEYDSLGNAMQEHVWFNSAPVAVLSGANAYYVHTDHLGTPRAVTDGNTTIWRWESDAFGSTAAQEDPDGDLTPFTYNLRFPGQYFDVESGLHYNYYRTYDPGTGRYLESDPIGLTGGLNTYGYVGSNPLSYADAYGLYEIRGGTAGQRALIEGYAETLQAGLEECGCEDFKNEFDSWDITIRSQTNSDLLGYTAYYGPRPVRTVLFANNFFGLSNYEQQLTFLHEFRHVLDVVVGMQTSPDLFRRKGAVNIADQWTAAFLNKDWQAVCPEGVGSLGRRNDLWTTPPQKARRGLWDWIKDLFGR